jgi:hypothetical protein
MKKNGLFSSRAFKKGTLSFISMIVILVAVVLVNVAATAVSQKHPFSVDLTANKDYTISLKDEYASFVQGIDQKVTITVCAPKDDFNNGNYASYMVQNLMLEDLYNNSGVSDTTTKYARQVGAFVQSFGAMNGNISVSFVNPNSVTEFSPVASLYPNEDFSYGDMIVACQHTTQTGETMNRYQVLTMQDIFTLQMNQEYYAYGVTAYAITGSSLAGDVVSALYIVTSESSVEAAVLGGHDTSADYVKQLKTFLNKNNYTFTEVDNLLKEQISDQAMFAVIAAPMTDYSAAEIKVLEDFLENGGKYGRTLAYFPSCSQPVLPNLEEFLAEWGIEILPAVAWNETEGAYHTYPYMVFAQPAQSEYTADFDSEQQYFSPMNYRLARTTFESREGFTTEKILTTAENTYGFPIGEEVAEDWTVADAKYKGQFDLVLKSSYQPADTAKAQSNVLVISGDYFAYEEIISSTAFYNSTLLLNLFNGLSGQEDGTTVAIEDKVISTTSFVEKTMNTYAPLVMMIFFIGIVPVSLIAISLVIWYRRKRK